MGRTIPLSPRATVRCSPAHMSTIRLTALLQVGETHATLSTALHALALEGTAVCFTEYCKDGDRPKRPNVLWRHAIKAELCCRRFMSAAERVNAYRGKGQSEWIFRCDQCGPRLMKLRER